MKITEIRDLKDMPDFNWESQKDRGTWSTQDVSEGNVALDDWWQTPNCIDHNAMNAVNPDRSIWRCLQCGRACYMVRIEVDTDQ